MENLPPGLYEHYKGHRYEVPGVGINSETLEEMVMYKQLYDHPEHPQGTIWIRPKKMFFEFVTIGGKAVPRFKFLGKG